jgi:hypothetical protein
MVPHHHSHKTTDLIEENLSLKEGRFRIIPVDSPHVVLDCGGHSVVPIDTMPWCNPMHGLFLQFRSCMKKTVAVTPSDTSRTIVQEYD